MNLSDDQFSLPSFAQRVQERFTSRADVMAAFGGDDRLNPHYAEKLKTRTFKEAAVLIGVLERDGVAHILLTQRTEHLSSHSGQIAFPGGKLDEGETAVEAAVREAQEEVGLNPAHAEILGEFGTYYSGSGYAIHPVVARLNGPLTWQPNPDEVASVFEVPLAFLMDQQNHRTESRYWNEQEIFFFTMPYRDQQVEPPVERRIWGVTAGIIRMVQERLYGTP